MDDQFMQELTQIKKPDNLKMGYPPQNKYIP